MMILTIGFHNLYYFKYTAEIFTDMSTKGKEGKISENNLKPLVMLHAQ